MRLPDIRVTGCCELPDVGAATPCALSPALTLFIGDGLVYLSRALDLYSPGLELLLIAHISQQLG